MRRRELLQRGAAVAAGALAAPLLSRFAPNAAEMVSALTVPYVSFEAQDWWSGPVGGGFPDSTEFPFRHVHMSGEFPWTTATTPVSGIVEVRGRAFTHDNTGTLKTVKFQDDKGGSGSMTQWIDENGVYHGQNLSGQTILIKINRELAPDEVIEYVMHIDTSKFVNDGARLIRLYNVFDHPNGNQHVARPRFGLYVKNGKPINNVSIGSEGPTGWYKEVNPSKDWDYVLTALTRSSWAPLTPKSGIWTPTVKMNSPAEPIVEYSIRLDPNFHEGDGGTILKSGSGRFNGQVQVNTAGLTPGVHNLVILAHQRDSGKENVGVGRYPFTVAG